MTIFGVGKPVPSQLFLMQLAGLVVKGRARVLAPSAEQTQHSRDEGLRNLKKLTGQDFGFDVEKWFEYLKTQGDFGVTHPYGYASMRGILRELGHELRHADASPDDD